MKATTIALDFIKDIDGSFKVLELNTNVGFWPISQSAYSTVDEVTSYVSSSGASEIHYIGNNLYGNIVNSGYHPSTVEDREADHNVADQGPRIFQEIKTELSSSDFVTSYEEHLVGVQASSIPFVADTADKFIIRNAYDNTALVDTTYAANTSNFLQLVRDFCTGPNALSFPASYVAPSGSEAAPLDTIDINNYRYNGHHPNFIVKLIETGTGADNYNYPKLYHVSSSHHVQELKDNLQQGEILQEYIYNESDLIDGKLKTYRIAGLLAGPNLDSIHFFDPYVVSNILPVYHDNVDYTNTGSYDEYRTLEKWERPAYVQKLNSHAIANSSPNVVEGMKAIEWSTDNELDLHFQDLGVELKTYDIPTLPDTEGQMYEFTASYTEGQSIGTFQSASIVSNNSGDSISIQARFYLEDGETFNCALDTPILTVDEDAGVVKFTNSYEIVSGSKLASIDPVSGNITSKGVTSAVRYIHTKQVSHINVEAEDTFLLKGSGSNLFLIHNAICICYICSGTAVGTSPCLTSSCYYYPGCSTSYPYCYGYQYDLGTSGCSDGSGEK